MLALLYLIICRFEHRILTAIREVINDDQTTSQRATTVVTPAVVTATTSSLATLDANKSTVDYLACCGIGHRLVRMSAAYHLAREIQFGLRAFWGTCGGVEIFQYLFGPQPQEDLENVTSVNQRIPANNEVFGHDTPRKGSKNSNCSCSQRKEFNDIRFYSSLRDRFRMRHVVDDFVRQNFHDASFIIGIHIRAGQ